MLGTNYIWGLKQSLPCLTASTQVSETFHMTLTSGSLLITLPQCPHFRGAQGRTDKVIWPDKFQKAQTGSSQKSTSLGTELLR